MANEYEIKNKSVRSARESTTETWLQQMMETSL